MKMTGAAAIRYLSRPDPARRGLLIHGADAVRVAIGRRQAVAALIGPEGEAEMRLMRIAASEARSDVARIGDATRAAGFFPGPRVVLVEDAGDGLAPQLAQVLADWRPGDAVLVVTAGLLPAKSALRKVFEGDGDCVSAQIVDEPPDRDEVEAILRDLGLTVADRAVMDDVLALGRALDPGDFRQTLEKVALYRMGGDGRPEGPVTSADLAAAAPMVVEADQDAVVEAAADRRAGELTGLLRQLGGGSTVAVSLCIAATRHFRALHAAAADPGGAAAGIARVRPPVFGPRRDRMLRQAQAWGAADLGRALEILTEVDLTLRSSARVPGRALVERALIRLATTEAAGARRR
jgi:DNA polymerase-3 subunit delta